MYIVGVIMITNKQNNVEHMTFVFDSATGVRSVSGWFFVTSCVKGLVEHKCLLFGLDDPALWLWWVKDVWI